MEAGPLQSAGQALSVELPLTGGPVPWKAGREQQSAPSRALCFEWLYLLLPPGPRPCGLLGAVFGQLIIVAILFPSTDDSGDDDDETASPADKSELRRTIKGLSLKLDDLSTCNDLIAKHGAALQRSLSELDSLKIPCESSEKLKVVNERATLFRITSNAMINVSARPHQLAQGSGSLSPAPQSPSRWWPGCLTDQGATTWWLRGISHSLLPSS